MVSRRNVLIYILLLTPFKSYSEVKNKWVILKENLRFCIPENRPNFVLSYLSKNIKYRSDYPDIYEWSKPEIVLRRGYGDCADFACAAFVALERYEPNLRIGYCEINSTRMPGSGIATETHLVVMINRGKVWWILDQRSPYGIILLSSSSDLKLIYSWDRTGTYLSGGESLITMPPRTSMWWDKFLRK